jgi:hypothetical protein
MAKRQQTQDNLSIPIQVTGPMSKSKPVKEADDSFNRFIINERESHGKRTVIKVAFEVYCRKNHKFMNFVRFRNRSVLISCPNAGQAEACIQALERIIGTLHDKYMSET